MFLFWLILLGIFTYYVVQRSVSSITRTPTWLLWLVMMTPAFALTAWMLVQGNEEPPSGFLLTLFILCPMIYWGLIQWGRLPTPKATTSPQPNQDASLDGQEGNSTSGQDDKSIVRPISKDEEANLQNCFPWSIFFLQNIEYRPQVMICRGQLRTSPAVAYKTIQENVEAVFGKRFLVVFQEGLNGKPFFALVPNPQAKTDIHIPAEPITRPWLALGLLLTTLVTATAAGANMAIALTEDVQKTSSLFLGGLQYVLHELTSNPAPFLSSVAYALALIVILGTHELGHYLAARRYNIRATLPYFIPVPFFLGTLGAFIQLRSPVPNRKALFDVGIAGPLAGLLMTLPLLLWGLAHSTVAASPENASLLNFQALDPGASIILALLIKLAMGSQVTLSASVQLHPVAIAGCLGLVVTALNLMPVGQLDGGHIVHAMYGQRVGAIIGQISRFLVLGLVTIHPELLIWAILLFFIPAVDEPALNDVSELDNRRDLVGLITLTILVLIILPAPNSLMQLLFASA